jgi:transposase, IS30 family
MNRSQVMVESPSNRQVHKETIMHYHHLTEVERHQIEAAISLGLSMSEISRRLKRHRSTIFRELKRNGHMYREGYSAYYSNTQYKTRRERSKRKFIIRNQLKRFINERIKVQWSPEQIVGRCRSQGHKSVGIETIYRYLYRDKKQGGSLWINLRHSKGRRKKRFSSQRWPLAVLRPTLEQRPKIVEQRKRKGDFERDLIVGAARQGYLITIVDRKTKLLRLAKLKQATAEQVHSATLTELKDLEPKTITNDNGREFMHYKQTAKDLGASIYFCRPYASWERGTVENTNKLIRQYFPKKTNLKEIRNETIKMVEALLNNRPRKKLGFKTPIEANA